MVRLIFPVVVKTLFLLIPYSIGATAERDGFNIASTIQLAQETLDRLIVTPHETIVKEDEKDGKNNSVEENTAPPSEMMDGEGAQPDPATEKNEPTTTEQQDDEGAVQDMNLSYDGSDLIEWINSNGGFIHPNARIGLDPTGQYRGVFVKGIGEDGGTSDGIEDDDIIARIPWDLIVKPKDYEYSRYWSCEALHEMHRQFLLGDESPHAPYINYLKNQPRGRMPLEWTDAGKLLLKNILDHEILFDDESGSGLPPSVNLKDFQETWVQECDGEDTPLARAAFYQFTSRDEDTLMVPFYDMHNHSNDPKKLNTISAKPERKGRPFMLRSIRDIEPGEQIFISYNRCNRCWFDKDYKDCTSWSHYGTSQLFDIFGFVEDFPQTWHYRMNVGDERREEWDDLVFCLEASDTDGPLKVTFGDNYSEDLEYEEPVEANIKYLGNQLVRLKELESSMKEDNKLMQSMPKYEWEMAWRYHEALMTSMSAAILASRFADDEVGEAVSGDDEDSGDDSDDEDSEDDDSGDDVEDEEGRDEL
mmetsp:Transcript_10104/g.18205  ORF Transcript_10104/g.18205 Transcript_10104/m.18205 type:complete len:532 (+) Transcript_10104:110-1705(+)